MPGMHTLNPVFFVDSGGARLGDGRMRSGTISPQGALARIILVGIQIYGARRTARLKREKRALMKAITATKALPPKKPAAKTQQALARLMAQYPEVQLATLVDQAPAGDKWVHEIKFDGYRLLGFL